MEIKMEIIIYQDITDKQTKQLILFIKKYCNQFSIENDYTGKVSEETYEKIQNELRRYFQREDQKNRIRYETDKEYRNYLNKIIHIKNEQQAKKYFDKLKKENKSVVEEWRIEKDNFEEETYIPSISQGFLFNKITRITESSIGGLYNVLYYELASLDNIMKNMKGLFDYIYLDGIQFWNLTFYKDEKMIMQICTDRKEIECHFNKIQYEEFERLKIEFERIKK